MQLIHVEWHITFLLILKSNFVFFGSTVVKCYHGASRRGNDVGSFYDMISITP